MPAEVRARGVYQQIVPLISAFASYTVGGDFPPQAYVTHAPMAHHPPPLHVFPGSSAVAAFPGATLALAPGYGGPHFHQHQQLPPHHYHYQQHFQQHQQLQHHAAFAAQHALPGYPAPPGLYSQPQPGYTSPQPAPWSSNTGFGGRVTASQVDTASHPATTYPVAAMAAPLLTHPYHADPTLSMGVHPFMRHTGSTPSVAVAPRPTLAQVAPRLIALVGASSLPPATSPSAQLSAGRQPQPFEPQVGEPLPRSDGACANPVPNVPLSGMKRGRSVDKIPLLLSEGSGAAQLIPVTEVEKMPVASEGGHFDTTCAPDDKAAVEHSIAVSSMQRLATADGSGDSSVAQLKA